MRLKKYVKRVGDSVGIIFSKDEKAIHNIELGDMIDVTDMMVIKTRVKPQKDARGRKTNEYKEKLKSKQLKAENGNSMS